MDFDPEGSLGLSMGGGEEGEGGCGVGDGGGVWGSEGVVCVVVRGGV